MRLSARVLASGLVTAALAACGARAQADVIYDSAGFETPRFSTTFTNSQDPGVNGDLHGQDTPTTWLQSPSTGATATAAVVTYVGNPTIGTPTSPGSQLTKLSYASGNTRWAPVVSVTPNTAAAQQVVIDWDMNVQQDASPSTTSGPFFGIEAYGSGSTRIGGFGVNSATGELLIETPGNFSTVGNDEKVAFNTWQHYTMALNYANNTYAIYLNGAFKGSGNAFLNSTTTFTDADVSALQTSASTNPNGVAFIDNYNIITTTPEPASLGLIAIAVLGCSLRTRRRTSPASAH